MDPKRIRFNVRRFIVFKVENGGLQRSQETDFATLLNLGLYETDQDKSNVEQWAMWCGKGDYYYLKTALVYCNFGKKAIRALKGKP